MRNNIAQKSKLEKRKQAHQTSDELQRYHMNNRKHFSILLIILQIIMVILITVFIRISVPLYNNVNKFTFLPVSANKVGRNLGSVVEYYISYENSMIAESSHNDQRADVSVMMIIGLVLFMFLFARKEKIENKKIQGPTNNQSMPIDQNGLKEKQIAQDKLNQHQLKQDNDNNVQDQNGNQNIGIRKIRNYGISTLAYSLIICAVSIQIHLLLKSLWVTVSEETGIQAEEDYNSDQQSKNHKNVLWLNQKSFISAYYCATSIIVSSGALFNKLGPLQILIITVIGTFGYSTNELLAHEKLKVFDCGGSTTIFQFGAFYGFIVAYMLIPSEKQQQQKSVRIYGKNKKVGNRKKIEKKDIDNNDNSKINFMQKIKGKKKMGKKLREKLQRFRRQQQQINFNEGVFIEKREENSKRVLKDDDQEQHEEEDMVSQVPKSRISQAALMDEKQSSRYNDRVIRNEYHTYHNKNIRKQKIYNAQFLGSDSSMTDLTHKPIKFTKPSQDYPQPKIDYVNLKMSYLTDETFGKKNKQIICMFGILLLFAYFPSFNCAYYATTPYHQSLIIVNTILALISSLMTSLILQSLINVHNKYSLQGILGGCMSGGVIIGACGDLILNPCGVILIGCFGGGISWYLMGRWRYRVLQSLKVDDSCGVLFIFGIPGLMAGIISSIIFGIYHHTTSPQYVSDELSSEYLLPWTQTINMYRRTFQVQAGCQIAATTLSAALAIFTALISAFIIKKYYESTNFYFIYRKNTKLSVINIADHENFSFDKYGCSLPYLSYPITNNGKKQDRNIKIMNEDRQIMMNDQLLAQMRQQSSAHDESHMRLEEIDGEKIAEQFIEKQSQIKLESKDIVQYFQDKGKSQQQLNMYAKQDRNQQNVKQKQQKSKKLTKENKKQLQTFLKAEENQYKNDEQIQKIDLQPNKKHQARSNIGIEKKNEKNNLYEGSYGVINPKKQGQEDEKKEKDSRKPTQSMISQIKELQNTKQEQKKRRMLKKLKNDRAKMLENL